MGKYTLADVKNAIKKNKEEGYEPLVTDNNLLGAFMPVVSTMKNENFMESEKMTAGTFGDAMLMQKRKKRIIKESAMKGNGAVAWGPDNKMPAFIYRSSKLLPYTSQGLEYLANAEVGSGVAFQYKYGIVRNGVLTEHYCDFHMAGILLLDKIKKLRESVEEKRILPAFEEKNAQVQKSGEGVLSYRVKTEPYEMPGIMDGINENTIGTDEEELEITIREYAEWRRADQEIREFESSNDLNKIFNNMAMDDMVLDINYPLIGIEVGSKEKWDNKEWYPKIKTISYTPAIITRVAEKSDNGEIEYIYAKETWREYADNTNTANTVSYPTLAWGNIVGELKEKVEKKKRKPNTQMESWFATINKHLSPEEEYYTLPAWWSIYPSMTFSYAMTLMLDKSIARKNDISWRRIIYVEKGYLEDIYANDERGKTPEGREELRNELERKVNDFLSNKENNGKTMMVDYAISTDGKTLVDSIRVETLPETNQKSTEDEIHAISSVLFYALGVDPRLVGAVPGKQNSSSGTQARELELLNQKKLETRKATIRRLMTDIAIYNNWCPKNIYVAIKEKTLSTLDASKTGIVETNN